MGRRAYSMLVLAAAVLTGCARGEAGDTPIVGSLGADFGNAVQHNAAVQIVEPMPAAAGDGPPPLDGKRAAAAIGRYQGGAVRELEIESTTDNRTD